MLSKSQIKQFIEEDMPEGDITSLAIFGRQPKIQTAKLVAKQKLVVSGMSAIKEILDVGFKSIKLRVRCPDGKAASPKTVLAELTGPVQDLLRAERLCVNLLQHLSGIATLTQIYVNKAGHKRVSVLDTRKTLPGLRLCEKQAVRDGGGDNHRMSLSDQYLIKENHIAAAGSITKALNAAFAHRQKINRSLLIEIEVRDFLEFKEAFALKPDIILLDNMTTALIKKIIRYRNEHKTSSKVLLEISGGVNLSTIGRFAKLGVERISVGSLTHSAPAADISMLIG